MFRNFLFAFVVLAALSTLASPALTAEVTMRLRGSTLSFSGNVISFDGKAYRLETERFGKVNLDLRKYECVSGACSATTMNSVATAAPRSKETDSVPPHLTNNHIPELAEKQNAQLFQEFLKWKNGRAQKREARITPARKEPVQKPPVRKNFGEDWGDKKKALGLISKSGSWWR